MSKTKSGLILIAVGIGMHLMGLGITSQAWAQNPPSLVLSSLFVLLMIAPVVIGLFGVFRFVVGLVSWKKPTKASELAPSTEGVWPPSPKRPEAPPTVQDNGNVGANHELH